jgi:hypothetical protein
VNDESVSFKNIMVKAGDKTARSEKFCVVNDESISFKNIMVKETRQRDVENFVTLFS